MINNLVELTEEEILSEGGKIVEIESFYGKRTLVYDKNGKIIKDYDNAQNYGVYELRLIILPDSSLQL